MHLSLALIVAGCVFGFVSFMHLLRLFFKVNITIAGRTVPMWASVTGFLIPLLLCIWMFMINSNL